MKGGAKVVCNDSELVRYESEETSTLKCRNGFEKSWKSIECRRCSHLMRSSVMCLDVPVEG